MEKTIVIDGKDVRLRSSAASTRRYKMQFKRDFFSDIFRLHYITKLKNADGKIDLEGMSDEEIAKIDFEVLFNLIWTFAKTADKTISEPVEWEDQFESFPLAEILPQIIDLLTNLIDSKKK